MKKLVATLIVFFVVMGTVNLMAQNRITLDLDKNLSAKITTPFTRNYDVFGITFKDLPTNIDWTQFNRVVVKVQCKRASGRAITDDYGNAVCSIFYEGNPDNWDDPAKPVFYEGANVPIKADNIGSKGPAPISTDRGTPIKLTKAPGGIMIQNTSDTVVLIEVLEITFFKN
jgi:uncharacterized membrane protein